MLPFVSVVIPVRNDARRLAVCLASLGEQDYPSDRFEVIVVDNGSTDDSRLIAEKAGAKVLCFPELRVGALRNRGVAEARGEILAFVDSDHEVPRGWLQSGVGELAADFEINMIGSPYLAPPRGTWIQHFWELHRLRNRRRCEVKWLGTGNLFVRRADFDRLEGFNEALVAAEDVDLCERLSRNSGKIISDMRTANIHHGEAPTLRQFFRKEYWRGSSGIRAFFAHGMPLHEVPSLIWPLYHLVGLLVLLGAVGLGLVQSSLLLPAVALGVLLFPSLALAVKTCVQVRHPWAIPALAVLYFVYGLARAAALFKR
jgi:glycosyltransferase involved in cell wall biosynthesis